MTSAQIRSIAEHQEFDRVAILDTAELKVVKEYREYCRENTCGNYDANYGCPPDCGTPEFMEARVRSYQRVLIMQTRVEVDDIEEKALLMEIRKEHNRKAREVADALEADGMDLEGRLMLPGPCSYCAVCQKKNGRPCPFPKKRTSCVSAYGIDVTQMCEKCGMRLDWDGSSITYFSLILLDPIER